MDLIDWQALIGGYQTWIGERRVLTLQVEGHGCLAGCIKSIRKESRRNFLAYRSTMALALWWLCLSIVSLLAWSLGNFLTLFHFEFSLELQVVLSLGLHKFLLFFEEKIFFELVLRFLYLTEIWFTELLNVLLHLLGVGGLFEGLLSKFADHEDWFGVFGIFWFNVTRRGFS